MAVFKISGHFIPNIRTFFVLCNEFRQRIVKLKVFIGLPWINHKNIEYGLWIKFVRPHGLDTFVLLQDGNAVSFLFIHKC